MFILLTAVLNGKETSKSQIQAQSSQGIYLKVNNKIIFLNRGFVPAFSRKIKFGKSRPLTEGNFLQEIKDRAIVFNGPNKKRLTINLNTALKSQMKEHGLTAGRTYFQPTAAEIAEWKENFPV